MRHDEDRLRDILEAIDAIQRRVPSTGREAFDADEMVRVWCLHHLTIVGEATARLSQEFRDRHPSCPWRQIIGMRNAIVHGYFGVSWDEVWNAVAHDVGPLRSAVESVLREEGWD